MLVVRRLRSSSFSRRWTKAFWVQLCALVALALLFSAQARITDIVIDRVESPAFEGRVFGGVGQYEFLIGRAFGEIDPNDPLHEGIVYIDKAPRNARGMVEYEVDLHILRPINMDRGNQTLFYDVVNRGGKVFLRHMNAAPGENNPTLAEHAGDGFLMRQGFTLVWSGWHGDVEPGGDRAVARFPVASNPDGSPIRQWTTVEFLFNSEAFTVGTGMGGTAHNYPAVEESMDEAVLVRRQDPHAVPEVIPRDEWSFAECPDGQDATPSNTHVCYPEGFSPDYIYHLVFEAEDPIVMGLGFAATRDVNSFLRYDISDMNPLVSNGRNPIEWTMTFGSSQSGRFLKHLLYEGFNEDEDGRIVFDGMIPSISGGRLGYFNHEFAKTTMWSRVIENHFQRGDDFPFTYATLSDPISGETDGLLVRCQESGTCPKIMQTDNAAELWQARASLVYTDPLGTEDIAPPENVRYYLHAGVQHGPAATPSHGICQQLSNPNRYQESLRAITVAMRAWIAMGIKPPASNYPTLAEGTLVASDQVNFPDIPGVTYTGEYNRKFINDYSVQPPQRIPGTEYTVMVSQVDEDGNDLGGIRSVTLQAPLGTYTGWNVRAPGHIEGRPCSATGSFIPFAVTADERGDDPRLSLEERYGDHEGYVDAVREAADALLAEGYLLQEDHDRLIAEAEEADIGLSQ